MIYLRRIEIYSEDVLVTLCVLEYYSLSNAVYEKLLVSDYKYHHEYGDSRKHEILRCNILLIHFDEDSMTLVIFSTDAHRHLLYFFLSFGILITNNTLWLHAKE